MKSKNLLSILLGLALCGHIAHAQDMDTALSKLTEDLAVRIQDNGSKKVTVLDFSDLEGRSSELGKYIADQLTVNFVMSKRSFSVLDRANRNKILAELKLTQQGLIDPENAKQLGKFSGVDALIVGTIVPIGTNITLTIKVVTTETSEVVAGTKAKFASDATVQQFFATPTKSEAYSDSSSITAGALPSQQFSNLVVTVEKVSIENGNSVSLELKFQNNGDKNAIAVAMYSDSNGSMQMLTLSSILRAGDGSELQSDSYSTKGIGVLRCDPDSFTILQPGHSTKGFIIYKHYGWAQPDLSRMTSFTLLADLIVNDNYHRSDYENYQMEVLTRPPHCTIEKLSLDLKVQKQ